MNPNYDQPRHMGFQREIGFACMFCHNGYPEVAPGEDASGREPRFRGRLPEGIDCQRCHGPGRNHIKALKVGASLEKIRAAILNPARLNPESQLEVCMQCHLETTTRSLPHAVVRFDRNVFSFRPGEPLADYVLNFDYAPGRGHEDRFEIAHTVYRLRKSACFLSTAGTPQAMTCTTCHNPHKTSRGARYVEVCRRCHAADFKARVASGRHTASSDCLLCHMPKRRTDDVIHAVMTDHYIQRRKPDRDLLATLAEQPETEATRYRGEVVLYYPPRLPQTPETELYLAAAQVIDAANLAEGIPRLRRAVEVSKPKQAGFYFHLAEAYSGSGKPEEAFRMYEAALARAPKHRDAWLNYSVALSKAGRTEHAARVLEQALEQLPDDPLLLSNLGEVYLGDVFSKSGIQSKALEVLRRAVDIDPGLPAAQNNMGLAYSRIGNNELAVRAWKEAIRIQPD
jgi:Tfp pilus assembly protein PilF